MGGSILPEERGRRRGQFLRDGLEQVQAAYYTGRPRLSLMPQPIPYGGRDALEGAIVEEDWAGWVMNQIYSDSVFIVDP